MDRIQLGQPGLYAITRIKLNGTPVSGNRAAEVTADYVNQCALRAGEENIELIDSDRDPEKPVILYIKPGNGPANDAFERFNNEMDRIEMKWEELQDEGLPTHIKTKEEARLEALAGQLLDELTARAQPVTLHAGMLQKFEGKKLPQQMGPFGAALTK